MRANVLSWAISVRLQFSTLGTKRRNCNPRETSYKRLKEFKRIIGAVVSFLIKILIALKSCINFCWKTLRFYSEKKLVFQVFSHVDIFQDCKIGQNKIHCIGIKFTHLDWHSMDEENKSFGKNITICGRITTWSFQLWEQLQYHKFTCKTIYIILVLINVTMRKQIYHRNFLFISWPQIVKLYHVVPLFELFWWVEY